jgi:cellobiose phosphorylase
MLNPINHAADIDAARRYRLEPYAVAADVYAADNHTGRGGWSWYTGSAGWMYRMLVESLLGLRREGDRLHIEPRVPDDWERWTATWRHGRTRYHIEFVRKPGDACVADISVDGQLQPGCTVELVDDDGEHEVLVRFGERAAALPPAPALDIEADNAAPPAP